MIVDSGLLPVGWEIKQLGEVCHVIGGGTPFKGNEEFYTGEIPWATVRDMKSEIISETECRITEEAVKKSSTHIIEKGNVVIATRVGLGKVCMVAQDTAINQDLKGIIPKDNNQVLIRFLFWWLKNIASLIKKEGTGATVQGVKVTFIHALKMPIPLLAEQKRIVAILDEAFEGCDRAIRNTEKNLANARELFESYLNSIFTQRSNGWVDKKLGDSELIQIIDGDRGTNYPQKSDFYPEGHCLFLNTKNVRSDGFNFDTTMFITEEKDNLLRKGKLKRRDVILTTRGTIGNIAIYDDNVKFDHIRVNSGMLIFRPNENIITSEYLFEVLRSSSMKSQIEKFTSGAAQPQLPIKTLVNFTFPVPTSLEEQSCIVSNLHDLSTETQRLETIYRQKLAALKELKQSILQKAFTGELTADKEVA